MLGAITIDKLAQIFFVSHRVKIILKFTVNFVSCETFSYAILILIFVDISTFPYFCKTLQDVFRSIFVSKKNQHRGGTDYYPLLFRGVRARIGQCTIQLLRRHTEITYLKGTLVSSFPFFSFLVGGGGEFQTDTRMNDERMCS